MRIVITALALSIWANLLSAATVTADFDLRSGGSAYNQSSFSYSMGDLDLTVSGMVCLDGRGPNHSSCNTGTYANGNPFDPRIDRSRFSGIYFNQPSDSDHHVDGDGYTNEFLKLSFNLPTLLKSLTFSYWDSNDNAIVYVPNGRGGWSNVENIGSGSSFTYQHAFTDDYESSMFALGARGGNDEWKLKKISVSYEVSPVPLPASGWLLIAAFGGLAAMRHRKRAV